MSDQRTGRVFNVAILTSVALLISAQASRSEELIGAKQALQQVRNQIAKQAPAEDVNNSVKTIRELPKQLEQLAPPQAAMAWLAAYDQWSAGPHRFQFRELVNALPSPDAWAELDRAIEGRPVAGNDAARVRALGLRMLGHRLADRRKLP